MESGWHCINKYYLLSNTIFSHQNFQVLVVMALIKAVYYGCFNSFHTKKIAMHGPHAMSYKLRGKMGVHHAVQ